MRKALHRFATHAVMGLALAFGAAVAHAATPTLISSAGGVNCYNFNDYIASTDSPVVGGWMTYSNTWRVRIAFSTYRTEGSHYIAPFGAMCSNSGFGAIGGNWYGAGSSVIIVPAGCYDCAETFADMAPSVRGICPANTATIKVDKYLRSDGVWMVPPASNYVGGFAGFQETPSAVWLCVKTDTYQ